MPDPKETVPPKVAAVEVPERLTMAAVVAMLGVRQLVEEHHSDGVTAKAADVMVEPVVRAVLAETWRYLSEQVEHHPLGGKHTRAWWVLEELQRLGGGVVR